VDVIRASIPLFFALIGLELLVARLRQRPLYRLADSISGFVTFHIIRTAYVV